MEDHSEALSLLVQVTDLASVPQPTDKIARTSTYVRIGAAWTEGDR